MAKAKTIDPAPLIDETPSPPIAAAEESLPERVNACTDVIDIGTMTVAAPMASSSRRHRVSHVQIHFRGEPDLKERLVLLCEGLDRTNARLKPRSDGEPARPVTSPAEALKWLLENLQPAE